MLEDTANLDFTTIPYWGDDSHLENNWSGKRGKALGSMLAVLAHDHEKGWANIKVECAGNMPAAGWLKKRSLNRLISFT